MTESPHGPACRPPSPYASLTTQAGNINLPRWKPRRIQSFHLQMGQVRSTKEERLANKGLYGLWGRLESKRSHSMAFTQCDLLPFYLQLTGTQYRPTLLEKRRRDLAHITRMLKSEPQVQLDPVFKQWLAQPRTNVPF